MNIKYLVLTTLLYIIGISLVSGASPSFGVFQVSKDIKLVQLCYINGTICDACNITSIDYPNGTSAVSDAVMAQGNGDFTYVFTSADYLGKYRTNGYCTYGSDVKKPFVAFFEVTRTGEKLSLSSIIIVVAFLIMSIICLVLGYSFQTDYWLLKTFFYFCSVLAGILAVNSARIIASESMNLSKMGDMGLLLGVGLFSFFFIFMFVFAFIEIIKSMREKKGVRWNYD